ncbi:hypothetical protein REPUB_Repub17cG0021400 [Reevesia pubescens]
MVTGKGLRGTSHQEENLKIDGIAGLYRGFNTSCVGIIVYLGLYFGAYDFLKPVVLIEILQDSFFASFVLGRGGAMCLIVG